MVGGRPSKIVLAFFTPSTKQLKEEEYFRAPALVVLAALVFIQVSFGVELVSTFVAGELGRPGKSRQVCLASVVGAIPLLLDNRCPLGICGGEGGGGEDDRLVVQVHLHLLDILLPSSSPSPPSCSVGIPLQQLTFLGPAKEGVRAFFNVF